MFVSMKQGQRFFHTASTNPAFILSVTLFLEKLSSQFFLAHSLLKNTGIHGSVE